MAEMDHVPGSRRTVIGGVLAHGGNDAAVGEGEAAQSVGRKQLAHDGFDEWMDESEWQTAAFAVDAA